MIKIEGLSEIDQQVLGAVNQQLRFISETPDLPKRQANMMYVCLAYELFIMDAEEEGYKILQMAEPEYFKEPLGEDMKANPQFNEVVLRIMGKLIEIGVVRIKTDNE